MSRSLYKLDCGTPYIENHHRYFYRTKTITHVVCQSLSALVCPDTGILIIFYYYMKWIFSIVDATGEDMADGRGFVAEAGTATGIQFTRGSGDTGQSVGEFPWLVWLRPHRLASRSRSMLQPRFPV